MLKWIIITGVVLLGFLTILLGLGYLLHENEKETTLLKQQLDQVANSSQPEKPQSNKSSTTQLPDSLESFSEKREKFKQAEANTALFKSTLVSNLTCVDDQQCTLFDANFKNAFCHVAVNRIGATLLSKIDIQRAYIPGCTLQSDAQKAVCQNNLCTLTMSK